VRDLAPPGDLTTQVALPFEFGAVEMQYESYRGSQARSLRPPRSSQLPAAATRWPLSAEACRCP
jgi:hypothetical protein